VTIAADIFCKVIDNFGDLGVCWRLARQLHREHDVAVTLWVDDLASFARMAPSLSCSRAEQMLNGVRVCHWQGEMAFPVPGDLVIEGFGCPLPQGFLTAMAARPRAPVWLNLEYLSAEDWVEDCHGLPSAHPQTGLMQHFWFPGFTERTGGLLRERGLLTERDRFQADPVAQAAFWTHLKVPEAVSGGRRYSLFAYENAAIPAWLDALELAAEPAVVLVPEGRALKDVMRWAGREGLAAGDRIRRGGLTVVILPFLSHDDYDRLLWACDMNAVRGEDSFVRAQWAGRPLLWHIYPQEEGAHRIKLEAFLARVTARVAMPAVWVEAMRAWNEGRAEATCWNDLVADLAVLTPPAMIWSNHLAAWPDIATSVMRFYASQVEWRPSESLPGTGNA
jgi:uncharacterized repeat protein (TIGR03837 family)